MLLIIPLESISFTKKFKFCLILIKFLKKIHYLIKIILMFRNRGETKSQRRDKEDKILKIISIINYFF